jgi:23S rRNA (cytosine1962-C5)-methyltransferase
VTKVRVRPPAAAAVLHGHPWIYRDAIVGALPAVAPGAWVEVWSEAGGGDSADKAQDAQEQKAPMSRARMRVRRDLPGGARGGAPFARGGNERKSWGERLGIGLLDPASPIAVRMWVYDACKGVAPAVSLSALGDGGGLLRERLAQAFRLRAWSQFEPATTTYRLLHGESDNMPGVVIDRYGPWAILRTDGEAARALVQTHRPLFCEALQAFGVEHIALSDGRGKARILEPWTGTTIPDRIQVAEHGLDFLVDLARGQKTGAFLDQRDNRAWVRNVGVPMLSALSPDSRHGGRQQGPNVRGLNLFSYAGGFSLAMAAGGASSVTSVDIAFEGHRTGQDSRKLLDEKGVPTVQACAMEWVTSDVVTFLERARERGDRWDLIVCDPPSYAPSERARNAALASYRRLHQLCASVLRDGGLFCAASCSSHVHLADFLSTLDGGSLGRDDLRIVEVRGAPLDHPSRAEFPEGQYLKFVALRSVRDRA